MTSATHDWLAAEAAREEAWLTADAMDAVGGWAGPEHEPPIFERTEHGVQER